MRNYSVYNNAGCNSRGNNNAGYSSRKNNSTGCNNRNNDNRPETKDSCRTKLIIEDNTIYEIDLDCYECRYRENRTPQQGARCPDRTVSR